MRSASATQRFGGTSRLASNLATMLRQYVGRSGAPGKIPAIPTTAIGDLFIMLVLCRLSAVD
ncbi:MAG: hypothetical protein P8Y40_02690 [Desulfobacterales bacterium]